MLFLTKIKEPKNFFLIIDIKTIANIQGNKPILIN